MHFRVFYLLQTTHVNVIGIKAERYFILKVYWSFNEKPVLADLGVKKKKRLTEPSSPIRMAPRFLYMSNHTTQFDLKKQADSRISLTACRTRTTGHKHEHGDSKKASINGHLPLCEQHFCNPLRGFQTPHIVEFSFTPLRRSRESKWPIKKQLQAAAGAASCSH